MMNLPNFLWKIEFMKVITVNGALHSPKQHDHEFIRSITCPNDHQFYICIYDVNIV
jgi:hypothetical protein